jgi:TATA-box binding protein (TBP) (component of TFIID and TFIIIB)
MKGVKVLRAVYSGVLGHFVDLDDLNEHCTYTHKYNPDSFSAMIITLTPPLLNCKLLVFTTGSFVIIRRKSADKSIDRAMPRIRAWLAKFSTLCNKNMSTDDAHPFAVFCVHSIMYSTAIGCPIDTELLQEHFCFEDDEEHEYVTVRVEHPFKHKIIAYPSGRIIIAGMRNTQDIKVVLPATLRLLASYEEMTL